MEPVNQEGEMQRKILEQEGRNRSLDALFALATEFPNLGTDVQLDSRTKT